MEKLKNDSLTFIFCTNATGSHKLSLFYIYIDIEEKTSLHIWQNI